MGLFSALRGNAGAVSQEELKKEYAKLLIEGEEIELGFKVFRDTFVFTTKRLILIDKQGVTGSKIEYKSITYKRFPDLVLRPQGRSTWMRSLKYGFPANNFLALRSSLTNRSMSMMFTTYWLPMS